MSEQKFIYTDETGSFHWEPTGTGIKIRTGGINLTGTQAAAAGTPVAGTLTAVASTVSGDITSTAGNLVMGATTLSETDLAKIDGITNGTAAVSKALVLDSSGDLTMVASRTLNMNGGPISNIGSITAGKVNLRYDLASGSTGGNQGSYHSIIKRSSANINNNTATTVLTASVPNLNNSATIRLKFLATLGLTDAFESTRYAEAFIVVARIAGGATVVTASALANEAIATTSGGATLTLAYATGAITGADSATQTFTITVTIVASGATNSNTCLTVAEVMNETNSGVTVS